MVDVSDEWIENIDSIKRKQGYVIVTITTPNKTMTISSLDTTGIDLKSIMHRQTFDPVGLSLPENNIEIELYNYNGQYNDIYEQLETQTSMITVQYGFVLSKNETIKGGEFYVDDVSEEDSIIIIKAISLIEYYNNSDSIPIISFRYPTTRVAYDGASVSNSLTIASQYTTYYFKDLMQPVANYVKLKYSEIGNYEFIPPADFDNADLLTFLQKSANAYSFKFFNDRDGYINIYVKPNAPYRFLRAKNQNDKITLKKSKQISDIKLNSLQKVNKYVEEEPYHKRALIETEPGWEKYEVKFDTYNKKIKKIKESGNSFKYFEIDEPNQKIYFICRYTDDDVLISYDIYTETQETTVNVNDIGTVLDVDNNGGVVDTDILKKYFSNRLIYEVSMRGDPSLDAGDYVFLEIPNKNQVDTKKALILERELTFDGSFKDWIKVRAIDTDFEELEGHNNTHEELSKYTHTKLSSYTHKQLTSEVI